MLRRPERGPALAWCLCLTVLLGAFVGAGCTARFQPRGEPIQTPVFGERRLTTPDGYELPLRAWRPRDGAPPKAVVLAAHGFNDYSHAFESLGPFLSERGYAVFAYDQRGFGATRDRGIWPGTETLVADLETVAQSLTGLFPETPLVLAGESMGAAVVLSALGGETTSPWLRRETDRVILVAPAVWGWSTLNGFYTATLALARATVPGYILTAPRDLDIQPSDNIAMLRTLARDPLMIRGARVDTLYGLVTLMEDAFQAASRLSVPSLVLYGIKEDIIPEDSRARFLATLPPPWTHVALYPDGYHLLLRDLKAEVVLTDIAAWLEDPQAPLPSGLGPSAPAE